jgi:hypothetical protein
MHSVVNHAVNTTLKTKLMVFIRISSQGNTAQLKCLQNNGFGNSQGARIPKFVQRQCDPMHGDGTTHEIRNAATHTVAVIVPNTTRRESCSGLKNVMP